VKTPRQMLAAQLERDEKRVRHVYQDHLGYWTLGIGRLVDERKGGGLTDDEIDYLLGNDINRREAELRRRIDFFGRLDDVRKAALLNMAFQLGVDGLLGFKRMLGCLRDERFAEAETHALDSKWAKEDTPARARRVARQLATGEWQ
jgi:lysozyme